MRLRHSLIALALAATSVAQAQPAPRPTLTFGYSDGFRSLTISDDGLTMHGAATITFSPGMARGMATPTGPQTGWLVIRIGNAMFQVPVYQVYTPIPGPTLPLPAAE